MRLLLLVSTWLTITCTESYKHVVFMHGILAGPDEFDQFIHWLKIDHPGTNTTKIDAFDHAYSLFPLWDQVYKIQIQLSHVMSENPAGIHLVCFSQGGLVCRGLLSILKHNVNTFISLSCPLAGQYGDTSYLRYLFPTYLKDNLFRYFYTVLGQHWSVANYWYDPHHQDLYRKFSKYLAVLNNDTFNNLSEKIKVNFSRLEKLVLIGGPDDGVISPWQSSHFGMYTTNETVQPMQDQKWYINDSFGLKTLDKRGAITMATYSGIFHKKWHSNMEVYKKSILPNLT